MYKLKQISKELIRSDGDIPAEYFVAHNPNHASAWKG